MKYVRASVFVVVQAMSTTTRKSHRQRREREAYQLLASDLAWSRSVAFEKASEFSAQTTKRKRSEKRFNGLNMASV